MSLKNFKRKTHQRCFFPANTTSAVGICLNRRSRDTYLKNLFEDFNYNKMGEREWRKRYIVLGAEVAVVGTATQSR
jgi:hypothetical protein